MSQKVENWEKMAENQGFFALRMQVDCWKFILRQNWTVYGLNYIYQTNLLCHRSRRSSKIFVLALKCQKIEFFSSAHAR